MSGTSRWQDSSTRIGNEWFAPSRSRLVTHYKHANCTGQVRKQATSKFPTTSRARKQATGKSSRQRAARVSKRRANLPDNEPRA